jgi:hypothetical protein
VYTRNNKQFEGYLGQLVPGCLVYIPTTITTTGGFNHDHPKIGFPGWFVAQIVLKTPDIVDPAWFLRKKRPGNSTHVKKLGKSTT